MIFSERFYKLYEKKNEWRCQSELFGSGDGRAGVACLIWGSTIDGWGALGMDGKPYRWMGNAMDGWGAQWMDREHDGWMGSTNGALWMDKEHYR